MIGLPLIHMSCVLGKKDACEGKLLRSPRRQGDRQLWYEGRESKIPGELGKVLIVYKE